MFQRVASIAAPQDAGCRSSSKFSSLVLVGSKFSFSSCADASCGSCSKFSVRLVGVWFSVV